MGALRSGEGVGALLADSAVVHCFRLTTAIRVLGVTVRSRLKAGFGLKRELFPDQSVKQAHRSSTSIGQ